MTDEEYAGYEASAADAYDAALEAYRAERTDENRATEREAAAVLQDIRRRRRETREAIPEEG